MGFEYPRLSSSNSVLIWPRLCVFLSDCWRYAITRHMCALTRVMCVHISNLLFDQTCGYGYLSAKEAVFILTVLCQQSATKCNKASVERICAFLNIPSNALKIIRQQARLFDQREYGSNAPPYVYGTLLEAILFYQKLSGQLYEWGYEQNPYDP